MKRLIKTLAASVLLALLLPCAASAVSRELIASSYETFYIDMWHYSGGYWRIGNADQEKITISDSTMRNYGSIDSYLGSTQSIYFSVSLPEAVRQAVNGGETVSWTAAGRGSGGPLLFDPATVSELEFTSTDLKFSFRPKFNLVKGIDFSDFVTGLSNTIPLIDSSFGNNIFSMFGNGRSAVQANGWFSMYDPTATRTPYVHPTMIKNNTGALKPGYSINVGGTVVDTQGFSIGSGTFSAAGACGLRFAFPVTINYYKQVDDPPPPGPDDPSDPGPDDPGPPAPPAVPTPCAVTAELYLQGEAYEGHPVPASDWSVIEYGDQSYSAARAYAEHIASNSFKAPGGSLRKIYSTEAEITYSTAGTYFVTLTVTPETGYPASDVKSVNVLRTPSVAATVSGSQKQNRKQTLSVRVAQDPANPVQAVRITLTEPLSGESIVVTGSGAPQNTDNIKYRSLRDEGSDQYFLRYALDFLSRFDDARNFEYSVTAVDSRGRSASASGSFLVVKDEPPHAVIQLDSSYLRGRSSNDALIDPLDLSTTDGDELERFWSVSTDGVNYTTPAYTDLSFGSAQHISFVKTGVGGFSVKLRVRDVWVEETLEEYVSEADRLSDETVASSLVDNVAPVVSLGTTHFKTSEILLFTNETVDVKDLKMKLLARGIDAEIFVEEARPGAEPQVKPSLINCMSAPFGFATLNSSWDGGSVMLDEDCMYQLSATFIHGGDEYEVSPQQPFTLSAYDARDGSLRWQFILTESILRVSDKLHFSMEQDVTGRYVFLTFGSRTAVVSKATGRLTGVFSFEPGPCSAASDSSIYCFKADGIYKLGSTGSLSLLRREDILVGSGAAAMLGGKAMFICRRGDGVYAGFFDTSDESCEFVPLKATLGDPFTAQSKVVGIDTRGRIVLFTSEVNKLRVFDARSGSLLAQRDCGGGDLMAVTDPGGRINYVLGWNLKQTHWVQGNDTYASTHSLTGLYDDYSYSISFTNDDALGQYDYAVHAPVVACELYDGSVYMVEKASWKEWRFASVYNPHYVSKTLRMKSGDGSPCGVADYDALISWSSSVNRIYEAGRRAPGIFAGTFNNNASGESAASSTDLARLEERESDRRNRLAQKYFTYGKDYSLVETNADPEYLLARLVPSSEGISVRLTEDGGKAYYGLGLKPGRKYYYEYDSSSGAALSFVARNECFGSSPEGFRVVLVESEDFNDSDVNPAFTLNGAGLSSGRFCFTQRTGPQENDYNLYIDRGTLSFTVPEGYYGSLSFRDSSVMNFTYHDHWFTLSRDGEAEVRMIDPVEGLLTEKRLLEPGTYTLTGWMRSYYTNWHRSNELAIDDLRLCILEPDDSVSSAEYTRIPTVQSVSGQHVSGSFSAPQPLSSFGKLDAEYARGVECEYSSYSYNQSGGTSSETFAIPEGKTAVYLGFSLHSNGWASSATSSPRPAKWTWGGATKQRIPDGMGRSYYAGATTNMPEYYTWVGRLLNGTQTLSATFPGYRGGDGAVLDVEAVLHDDSLALPPTVTDGRYFITNGALYYEQCAFGGETLLTADRDADISSLRVWYMENGARVYVTRMPSAGLWQAEGATVTGLETSGEDSSEDDSLIYDKGEYVGYVISYTDYEDDPSKQSFYRYIHTPLNDGPAFGGETVLLTDAAIHRFYHDGKYVLQHWQTDDTGDPAFDKDSNVVEIVFYIRGNGSAPRIDLIRPDPEELEPGDDFSLLVAVSDDEGDDLTLTVELYLDGEKIWEGSSAASAGPGGTYSLQVFDIPVPAAAGSYDAAGVVRDASGAGIGACSFAVGRRPDPFALYRLHRIW